MALSDPPASLSETIAELNKKLSVMRHNVNNHLSLVVAASELMRRKPELATRLIESLLQQPENITSEIRRFSDAFETAFNLKPADGPNAQAG
jgi:hypothetical protein